MTGFSCSSRSIIEMEMTRISLKRAIPSLLQHAPRQTTWAKHSLERQVGRGSLAFAIWRFPTDFICSSHCRPAPHSTVTLFARFLGLSTSVPLARAV